MQLNRGVLQGATGLARRGPELRRLALKLHTALTDLVRQYQFRSRNEICCYGVTVSQCYLLDALSRKGALSMQELASHLCLKISTVTRVVDQLVKKRLVRRRKDPRDGRVVRVEMAEAGRRVHEKITEDLVSREEELLASISEEVREELVEAISMLAGKIAPSCRSPSAS